MAQVEEKNLITISFQRQKRYYCDSSTLYRPWSSEKQKKEKTYAF